MEIVKKIWLSALFSLVIPTIALAAQPAKTSNNSDENLDRIAAVVNDDIITMSEVDGQMGAMKQKLLMSGEDIPSDDVIRRKITDIMINKKLQLQIAERNQITAEVEDVNKAIQRMAEQNHIPVTQVRDELKKEGISYKQFRKDIKDQIIMHRVQERSLAGRVSITDKEADDFIKKMAEEHGDKENQLYHLADILIALPESPTSDQTHKAQQRAKEAMAEINNGTEFSKVAAKYSNDEQALEGGDMDWRKLAELPSLFTDQLKTMKDGEVRGPLRAPNGIHIIKLLGTKAGGKAPNREQVRSMLFQRKMMQEINNWLQQLRETSYVKVYV